MLTARLDFKDRSRQVANFLLWLSKQEKEGALPEGVMNTQKASCLLLIYNLMESTVTNALQAVADSLKNNSVAFDSLSKDLRLVAIRNVKKREPLKLVDAILAINSDIYHSAFVREEVCSGNVDARMIRETMKDYGIGKSFDYDEGELLVIKTKRNDLAHGSISFADAGRDLTAKEIIKKYWRVRRFLANMLTDFEAFISGSHYLAAV